MHGSESIKQVHAELVDLMGEVPEDIAEQIVGILYDDMWIDSSLTQSLTHSHIHSLQYLFLPKKNHYRCHLKPYAQKQENQQGAKAKQFAAKLMAVDKLHFRFIFGMWKFWSWIFCHRYTNEFILSF